MKIWIGYILSIYILLCTIVPCTLIDHCDQDQQTEQTTDKDSEKGCSDCSPFSICSSSHGFTLNTIIPSIQPALFNSLLAYSEYYVSSRSDYYSSLFQPPRLVNKFQDKKIY